MGDLKEVMFVADSTASNNSDLIDVNVKNRWSQSRNFKIFVNILRMCLYAPQTRLLQKVFCVGGGKNIQSHKVLQLSNDFAMTLQKVTCNSVFARRVQFGNAAG